MLYENKRTTCTTYVEFEEIKSIKVQNSFYNITTTNDEQTKTK